jgi:prophage tail gpP-like protein
MPKPIPGVPYVVVPGDTLSGIAKKAYGDPRKWKDLFKANQSNIRSGDPNNLSIGDILQIPPDTLKISALAALLGIPLLKGKDPDDFTVVIDGTEIPMESGRVIRTIDTAADGWSSRLQWDTDDLLLSRRLRPFKYNDAQVYLGAEQMVAGRLYTVTNRITNKGITKELNGASYTADAIDSTMRPPYEAKSITLTQRCKDLLEPLGITVTVDPLAAARDILPFKKVKAEKGDTIFEHLSSLASQRGILLSSNQLGEALLTVAKTTGKPVGTIKDEAPPATEFDVVFDGRKRFNLYKATRKTRRDAFKIAISFDLAVPRSRFLTFSADDTTAGNLQTAADWRRSKQLADSLKIPFPVNSWYDPNGELWKENTLVNVESEALHAPDGFIFMISKVEYLFEKTGTRAILSLLPPQVYSGDPIVEPWL